MQLLDLADVSFVSLTTFRKTGVPVPTPVWIVRDGDDLLVTTPSGAGKLKRLRNNPLVELRECSRMGKVAEDAPVVTAAASEEAETDRVVDLFTRKYKLEYRIMLGIEKLASKGNARRVIMRISDR